MRMPDTALSICPKQNRHTPSTVMAKNARMSAVNASPVGTSMIANGRASVTIQLTRALRLAPGAAGAPAESAMDVNLLASQST